MNGIYFFIPFILIASISLFNESHGEEQFRGYDYLEVKNQDGSYTRTLGLPPFIYNNQTNSYVEYIANGTIIQTEHGSVKLLDADFIYHPNGIVTDGKFPKFSDTVILKYADILDLTSWIYPLALNTANSTNSWDGTTLKSSRNLAALGTLDYKYILVNGIWKTQMEFTNNSVLNTKVFGFDQIIDINSDTIKIGGQVFNLDDYHNQVFTKQFLDDNNGNVIDFMIGYYYDLDIAYDDLYEIRIVDTGAGKSKLIFDFRTTTILNPGNTLVIDPSFGDISSSVLYRERLNGGTAGTSCDYTSVTQLATPHRIEKYKTTNTGSICGAFIVSFPLTNLPTNAVVTDSVLTYDVDVISGTALECDFMPIANNPASSSAETNWLDILDGTPYVTSDTGCKTVANDKSLDLGTTFDSDAQSKIGSTIHLGVKFTNMVRDAGDHVTDHSDYRLTLTYNLPPDPPKQVSSTVTPSTGVAFTWSAGETNGDTHQTFEVERLNTDGTTWDELTSTTSSSYSDIQPQKNSTAKYRVWDTGALGRGCSQFAMNSTIASNLQSHWPFCYTNNDSGILDNDGTISGNEIYTNSSSQVYFDFDGSTKITINDVDYDFITDGDPHSIVFIINDYTGTPTERILAKQTSGATQGFQILEFGGKVRFQARDSGGNLWFKDTTATVNDGNPHFIAYTNDGSGNFTHAGTSVYVDGVLSETSGDDLIASNTDNNVNLTIGDFSGGGSKLNSSLRNMMIFDKELDANEVGQLYHERIYTGDLALIGPPITDLTGTATSFSTIELSWTTPSYVFGTFDGYMINYTTPEGSPTTIITNNTGTADTDYEIFGLDEVETYSFRVGTWNEFGLNGSGNIFNATTTANFVIGSITIPTETNPDVVDISFTETDINATAKQVTVQYPNTFTLNCELAYQFAQTNQTYSNLTGTAVDSSYDSYYFNFTNVDNEIINIECWNNSDPTQDAEYVITQTSFPLLDQIANFRNGTYGTQGMFGAIDFITLVVIIFSMIGFNRVNHAVGLIFNVALIGALGYFEIIEVPSIIFGAIAVVVMFAITSTRKV